MMKMSKFSLILFIFLFNLDGILCGSLPPSIFFSVTYRDFLPGGCSFLDFGSTAANNAKRNPIKLAWGLQTSSSSTLVSSACANLGNFPDWFDALKDDEIAGHPDFEATQGSFYDNSVDCTGQTNFPVGSCLPNSGSGSKPSIVSPNLRINDAGIPKMVYCDESSDNARCGTTDSRNTQSNKKFFDIWYNDNLIYNKRIGQRLKLDETSSNSGLYRYLSTNNAQNDAPDFSLTDQTPGFFGPLSRFKLDGDKDQVFFDHFSNPQDAPAWPKANNDTGNSLDKGFWFTTELHTTFEFRVNDPTGMKFNFSGDDDFWAFINGKMAIDLGGLHPSRGALIDLDVLLAGQNLSQLLGLVNGEVYTLDIFHAERHRDASNFVMTTTLFPACNVLQSGTEVFDFFGSSFDQTSFDNRFLTTPGVELTSGHSFSLAQESNANAINFIFTKNKENIGRGFISKFTARVTGNTFGFAFVIHNDNLDTYPTTGGPNFNFKGVKNSTAIVFDLCTERVAPCAGQMVKIHYTDSVDEPNSPSQATLRTHDNVLRELKNGDDIDVEIIYYGGRPDFLEVYIGQSLFLRENNITLQSILGNVGGHVGLTATTTDSLKADIQILNWNLSTVEVDAPSTEPLFDENDFALQLITADNEDESDGFEFQTKDKCENSLLTGTLDELFDAKFIEIPNATTGTYPDNRTLPFIVPAVVDDFDTGVYSLKLKTDIVSSFSLVFVFGKSCALNIETFPATPPLTPFEPTVSFTGTDCFFKRIDNAVESFPVGVLPTEAPVPPIVDDSNDNLVVIVSSVGGGMLFFGLIAALILMQYRRKWNREKGYVKDGNLYKMDVQTKFDGANDYTETGKRLLSTQEEILRLKNQAGINPRTEEIDALMTENSEMKKMIRQNKLNLSNQPGGNPVQTTTTNPSYQGRKGKMDF